MNKTVQELINICNIVNKTSEIKQTCYIKKQVSANGCTITLIISELGRPITQINKYMKIGVRFH